MDMPVFIDAWPRLRSFGLAGGAATVLCMSSPATIAAEVLVFTDSGHPVQATADAHVIELDRPARIDAELAAGLPADPVQAAALAQQRLRDGGDALQRRIAQAYQGLTDAWRLGIAKLPAVVVDRREVVYGDPDVAAAVARIEARWGAQP